MVIMSRTLLSLLRKINFITICEDEDMEDTLRSSCKLFNVWTELSDRWRIDTRQYPSCILSGTSKYGIFQVDIDTTVNRHETSNNNRTIVYVKFVEPNDETQEEVSQKL